ncbi:MAG: hypothetical protein JWS10_1537 [Cypionkella sp.]|uniref:alginate O-acetyltransferase AlgF n=1 Tax=Cypionkella sp. TaxID=2811411 RepID=UPI002626CFF6|nr:alginate O-acetyltransferase AlgF [Cypionkella sp.]MDB5658922.1 hypothetical protein [Cypionkella sp.]
MIKDCNWKMILCLCWAGMSASAALAQDGGLYEDVPDPSASFVRVVAASPTNAVIDSKTFDQLDDGISGYVVVTKPGEINLVTGVDDATVTVAAGKYYSYVVGADGTKTLVPEDITSNPAQAVISFFNLSDLPTVDLYVPAAKAVALKGVAMNGAANVALKAPLKLDFEVRDGDKVLASLPAVDLQRRGGVAIVLRGSAGNYTVVGSNSALAN